MSGFVGYPNSGVGEVWVCVSWARCVMVGCVLDEVFIMEICQLSGMLQLGCVIGVVIMGGMCHVEVYTYLHE